MSQVIYKENPIKITLLDIKPSLKELEKNHNEISIIFQGINVFYNLRKLINNKTEIVINNCKNSLIMSLVKSDNLFASAIFNLKGGETWATFNYESSKSSSVKPNLNNINCIKIKIFCSKQMNRNKNILDKNPTQPNIKRNSHNQNLTIKKYNTNTRYKSNNNIKGHHNRYDSILTQNTISSNKCLNLINVNRYSVKTPINKKSSHKIKFTDIKVENDKSQLSTNKNDNMETSLIGQQKADTSTNTYNKNNLAKFYSYRTNNRNKVKKKKFY